MPTPSSFDGHASRSPRRLTVTRMRRARAHAARSWSALPAPPGRRTCDNGRAARRGRLRRQLDVHAVAAREVADVPLERRLQPEVVEHAGPEAERQVADGAEHAVDQPSAFGDGRRRPARRPRRSCARCGRAPCAAPSAPAPRDRAARATGSSVPLPASPPAAARAGASGARRPRRSPRCSSDRRSSRRRRTTTMSATTRPSSSLPEQPMQVGAKRGLPSRHLGALRGEIGVVQLLDFLRDRQHRLAPRHHFPPEKAGASKDLFGRGPVEQRIERLPVVVELGLQAVDLIVVARRAPAVRSRWPCSF